MVPESAVLPTGVRNIVFVDQGEGRMEIRNVELGSRVGDRYEVLAGLQEGERVVTSGNFLIDAESRLQAAEPVWQGGEQP
jgi:Cu(I)/Ag(I) efflux system membrane fusion protein